MHKPDDYVNIKAEIYSKLVEIKFESILNEV